MNKIYKIIFFGLIIFFAYCSYCLAREEVRLIQLRPAFYESLRYRVVNVHVGPGTNYPIAWVCKRIGWPVRVIAKYGNWLRITDSDHDSGWVIRSMVIRRSTVVVIRDTTIRTINGKLLAHVNKGYVLDVLACNSKCLVFAPLVGIKGFISKRDVWGATSA